MSLNERICFPAKKAAVAAAAAAGAASNLIAMFSPEDYLCDCSCAR